MEGLVMRLVDILVDLVNVKLMKGLMFCFFYGNYGDINEYVDN